MSYEDTKCPCGGRKERETMLCAKCEDWLKDHPEMATFRAFEADQRRPTSFRRHAAITLVTLARGRVRAQLRDRLANTSLSGAETASGKDR